MKNPIYCGECQQKMKPIAYGTYRCEGCKITAEFSRDSDYE